MIKNKSILIKRLLLVSIIMFFLLVLIMNLKIDHTDKNNGDTSITELSDKLTINEIDALEAHELLYKSMNITTLGDFPEDFGGDYIEGNKLIILVTNKDAIQRYMQIFSDNPIVEYKIVSRSYNEIQQTMREFFDKNRYTYDLYSYYVDVKNNRGIITTLGDRINEIEDKLSGTGIDIIRGEEVIPQ